MFWSKWVINSVLACLVAFFGVKTYRIWSEPHVLELKATGGSHGKKVKPLVMPPTRPNIPPAAAYDVVVEKDLFSPERKGPEQVPEDEGPESEKQIGPKAPRGIVLYGVVVAGESRKALVTNPDRRRDKRRFVWVSVGDSLGDYKLADIQADKVILDKDGEHYELSLYSGKKRRSIPVSTPKTPVFVPPSPAKKKAPTKVVSMPEGKVLPKRGKRVETPFGAIMRK